MSYGLMPYAVESRRLRAVLGARDEAVLRASSAGFDAARIDELIEDRLAGGPMPSARDLLRNMVFGEPYDDRLGAAYAYVLEHLCDRYGQFLDNRAWSPIRFSFFDEVGRAVADAGVSPAVFSVGRLVTGKPPVSLPPIDDFPVIGWLAEDEVEKASQAVATANLSAITEPVERQAAEALREWLRLCSERRSALACFYH